MKTFEPREEPSEALADEREADLLRWIADTGRRISPDGYVSEPLACELCGYERSRLAARVAEGLGVPRYHVAPSGRRRYKVRDVARWLVFGYHEAGY
ncbi:hypothetical protein BN2475_340169 [Paraburkholderia ribeironis]|uniref:Helix-turn-helix domain-containing protein n=1 Tax=Paraburkholderia ribeironis TaxID=1247936 RepID=A0A1N7S4G4_9BURK|nr:hypothetical protein [Paraburkholderia ribeironis]SIT42229.1 hypothetical protein BN2475_340169 [Paraburkholderia ribeironis]